MIVKLKHIWTPFTLDVVNNQSQPGRSVLVKLTSGTWFILVESYLGCHNFTCSIQAACLSRAGERHHGKRCIGGEDWVILKNWCGESVESAVCRLSNTHKDSYSFIYCQCKQCHIAGAKLNISQHLNSTFMQTRQSRAAANGDIKQSVSPDTNARWQTFKAFLRQDHIKHLVELGFIDRQSDDVESWGWRNLYADSCNQNCQIQFERKPNKSTVLKSAFSDEWCAQPAQTLTVWTSCTWVSGSNDVKRTYSNVLKREAMKTRRRCRSADAKQ